MADGTEASPRPDASDGVLEDLPAEPLIQLSEKGRTLIDETADLVVDLPD